MITFGNMRWLSVKKDCFNPNILIQSTKLAKKSKFSEIYINFNWKYTQET